MRKLFSTLYAIEAHLREINGHLLFLCHLAEKIAQDAKEAAIRANDEVE